LWGARASNGELLKLGFKIAQSSVSKYMVKRCGPPSQGWRNHAPDITAMELFVAPTIGFRPALRPRHYSIGAPKPRLDQRHTTSDAEWIARQIAEAFPWAEAPRCLIHDRDRVYGAAVTHRLTPWASVTSP
jgi:hypothetical protein